MGLWETCTLWRSFLLAQLCMCAPFMASMLHAGAALLVLLAEGAGLQCRHCFEAFSTPWLKIFRHAVRCLQ